MAEQDHHDELEGLLEELTKTQITEEEVEDRIVSLVLDTDMDVINDMPSLHRLQVKRLLKERDEHELANEIKE